MNILDSPLLKWWEKEDIKDLIEDGYPNLLEMSVEEIQELITQKHWQVKHLIDSITILENEMDTLKALIKAIEGGVK